MTAYGNLLKALIDFSDSKLSFISEKTGYDISYISKWCTQGRLPASKAVPQINRILAECFSHEIIRQHSLIRFMKTFSVQATEESLETVLYELLRNAYDMSFQGRSDTLNLRFLSKQKEITQFFNQIFPEMLNNYQEPLEIFCTLEICSFIRDGLEIFPADWNPAFNIHVKMALDTEALTNDKDDYMKELYYFINSRNYIYFDFYDMLPAYAMNVIIVKNHLTILCVLNENRKILAVTIIEDRVQSNEMLRHAMPSFKNPKLLLKSFCLNDFCLNNYYLNFYMKDNFKILLTKGFEFFLPEISLTSILKMASCQSREYFSLINQIRITWEEIFEKSTIEFFLLKSALYKYIENGEIIFACISYTMTPEERILHIKNTLDILKKNPNIRFYVIDDESTPMFRRNLRTSLYYNKAKLFLKNTGLPHKNGGPMYYTIHSKQILKRTEIFLDRLKSKPYCYAYNSEDVQNFYEKYQSLIERMINL